MRGKARNAVRIFVNRLLDSTAFKWLSAFTVLATLFSFIIALPPIQSAIYDKSPKLIIQITNQAAIIDISKRINGLTVMYQGNDLSKNEENVFVVRMRFRNIGKESITPARISSVDPLGFTLTNGNIILIDNFITSSPHLNEHARPRVENNSVLLDPNIVIDPGEVVALNLLVLMKNGRNPNFVARGKVAGQSKVEVQNLSENANQSTLLWRALSGSIAIQMIRIIFYAIILIGSFTIFANLWVGVRAVWKRQLAESKNGDLPKTEISPAPAHPEPDTAPARHSP